MIGKEYEYQAMAECERELWWYRCLHNLTLQKIKQYVLPSSARILDAGCGTGGMLGYLKEKGYSNSTGFDLSPDAVHFTKNNFQFDVKLLNILECDTEYAGQSFDIIISHDVLCLLKSGDDSIVLKKLVLLLKPGGFILMNFPAGKAFRGTHDIAVGIINRYSHESINELARGVIKIKDFLYWPFLLSPVIFAVRFFQRIKMLFKDTSNVLSDVSLPPASLNSLFANITKWENVKLKKKPWGSSIFVVMQKGGG